MQESCASNRPLAPRSLGSTVREGFFAALGKHLQLPSAKPEAGSFGVSALFLP